MLKLYTSHCPQCRAIEERLKHKNIPYETEEDMEVIMQVATKAEISQMPFALYKGYYCSGSTLEALIKTL